MKKDTKKFIVRMLSPVPDKLFLRIRFRMRTGKKLNLHNPITFNEKLQWLKLYYRNPQFTVLADKKAMKDYVASILGDGYVIPTLFVWDNVDEIDLNVLPDKFVLKTNHDSASIVVCTDKETFCLEEAKKKLKKSLSYNYYWYGREWPYKNIKPCIIAEEYIEDEKIGELRDYKFFVMNGIPRIMFVASGRWNSTKQLRHDFYDMSYNSLDLEWSYPKSEEQIEKIDDNVFNKMKELSKLLSNNVPFVRVDFYYANGKIYVGEFTFFHSCGMKVPKPEKWDYILGDWLKLPSALV